MIHKAHLSDVDMICCGYSVADNRLSADARADFIDRNYVLVDGSWWHPLELKDRADGCAVNMRAAFWKPDTGRNSEGLGGF